MVQGGFPCTLYKNQGFKSPNHQSKPPLKGNPHSPRKMMNKLPLVAFGDCSLQASTRAPIRDAGLARTVVRQRWKRLKSPDVHFICESRMTRDSLTPLTNRLTRPALHSRTPGVDSRLAIPASRPGLCKRSRSKSSAATDAHFRWFSGCRHCCHGMNAHPRPNLPT